MQRYLSLITFMLVLAGCQLYQPQNLSQEEVNDHIRGYVNTPAGTILSPSVVSGVRHKDLNKHGITAIDFNDNIVINIPTDIIFINSTTNINPQHQAGIYYIAKIAKNFNTTISITGHTSRIGTREYKYQQGRKLAEKIKAALWQYGVANNKMITSSVADTKPVASYNLGETSLNKRIEIIIPKN